MNKLFGILVILIVSLLTVYGVFEIGIFQYEYYIEKGFREETASLFSFMGLLIGIVIAVVLVLSSNLLENDKK